jgi:hypothetical protein
MLLIEGSVADGEGVDSELRDLLYSDSCTFFINECTLLINQCTSFNILSRLDNKSCTSSLIDCGILFEQRKSGEHLRRFVEHFTASSNGLDQKQAKASYATELFAPLNDTRFKPGQTAQRASGMLWRAWLSVECALIDDYSGYLVECDDYTAKVKQASQELERAREKWIYETLEQKFKKSKAYRKYMQSTE